LIEEGADVEALDQYGQGIVHMSAQTNDAYFIIHCHSVLNFKLDSPDLRGRTPLHLAALEGKEAPVGPLLALVKDVNVKDNEGLTPLHYAVMSENETIVKRLLMLGAERKAVDNRKKRPFHLATIKKNRRIVGMLKDQAWWSEFNPASHPLKPVKHRRLLFGFYHCVMFAWYCMVVFFILPDLQAAFSLVSLFLLSLNFLMFEAISRMNPGYIDEPNKDLLLLYSKYGYIHVCAFCRNRKGHKDVHCVYCNRCVKGFDHHCPWINNCVGAANQRFFIAFLICKQTCYTYHCVIGLLDYLGYIPHSEPLYKDIVLSNELLGNICGLAVSVLCALCSLAMTPCLYVQIRNFRQGSTGRGGQEEPSDTPSMLADINTLSEELLFAPRVSMQSESLVYMRVEDIYTASGCFGLCKTYDFTFKFDKAPTHLQFSEEALLLLKER
jgi:palmitoyltransferase